MYRIEISYPYHAEENKFFHTDYYKNKHMPWAKELLGGDAVIRDTAVEIGVPMGEDKPEYVCKGVLYVEDLMAFFKRMMQASAEFQADIPNFTDMLPPRICVYQIA